jgi:glutamine cyclotransferase
LTHDGTHLIQSDGTATLSFLDQETYQVKASITVTDQGAEVDQLNELEYIQGEIYANIWRTDYIVRIDPKTGIVLGWIDLSGILPEDSMSSSTDVLNGIAYEPVSNRLFVTGKNWPIVFEIRLMPKP